MITIYYLGAIILALFILLVLITGISHLLPIKESIKEYITEYTTIYFICLCYFVAIIGIIAIINDIISF